MGDPLGKCTDGADKGITACTETNDFASNTIFLLSKVSEEKVAERSCASVDVVRHKRVLPINNWTEPRVNGVDWVSALEEELEYSPGRSK